MPHPLEGLPERGKEPRSIAVLSGWVNQAQERTGLAADRLSWMVASSIVIAVLQRSRHVDAHPRFLLKGGAMLELKLGLGAARATKDIDMLFRGSFDEFVASLDEALVEPWGVLESHPDRGSRRGQETRQATSVQHQALHAGTGVAQHQGGSGR